MLARIVSGDIVEDYSFFVFLGGSNLNIIHEIFPLFVKKTTLVCQTSISLSSLLFVSQVREHVNNLKVVLDSQHKNQKPNTLKLE